MVGNFGTMGSVEHKKWKIPRKIHRLALHENKESQVNLSACFWFQLSIAKVYFKKRYKKAKKGPLSRDQTTDLTRVVAWPTISL